MGAGHGCVPVGVVADGQLAHPGLPGASVPVEAVKQVALRLGRDHQVGAAAREGAGGRAGDRDADRHPGPGQVPQPGVLDVEVGAVMADVAAVEEGADDLHGLFEHLQPYVGGRPAPADDVFVEVLAGAEAEPEPALGEDLECRGLLGDDGGVVAGGRTGHVRHQANVLGRLCRRAEHRPGVRGVALLLEPGKVVVGGDGEVESRLFRGHHVPYELSRSGLFGHHRVADSHHAKRFSPEILIKHELM
ncbi:hypothetical protein SMICM304S_02028 [Streptomyces microflavus]